MQSSIIDIKVEPAFAHIEKKQNHWNGGGVLPRTDFFPPLWGEDQNTIYLFKSALEMTVMGGIYKIV